MLAVAPLTGTLVDTAAPDLEGVTLADCWHALSHLGRWHGSTVEPWTVGDHLLAGLPKAATAGVATWWLGHELAEAFLGDIPSPLRVRSYDITEDRLLRALLERFGVDEWPMPAEVKVIDKRMAATEAKQLLHPDAFRALDLPHAPYRGMILQHRTPRQVREELARAARARGLG